MGKTISSLRLPRSQSHKDLQEPKGNKLTIGLKTSAFKTRSTLSYLPKQSDPQLCVNPNSKKSNDHDGPVTTLTAIQPDTCISGGKDKLLLVQNVETGEIQHQWIEHKLEISKVCARRHMVASSSRDLSIKIWDLSKDGSIATLAGHTLNVTAIDFNSDCTQICSGSRDNTVRFWDIDTETCETENRISRNLVTDLKWDKSKNIVLQSSEDKMLKVWDVRIMEVVHSFPPQKQIQTCCDIKDNLCITGNNGFGGNGCEVSLWDLRSNQKVSEFRGHMESVTDCCFVTSVTKNRFFATCSKDGSVCLWQEYKLHPTAQKHLDVGPLTSIAMLNNDVLLSGSFSRGIRKVKRTINEQLIHEH